MRYKVEEWHRQVRPLHPPHTLPIIMLQSRPKVESLYFFLLLQMCCVLRGALLLLYSSKGDSQWSYTWKHSKPTWGGRGKPSLQSYARDALVVGWPTPPPQLPPPHPTHRILFHRPLAGRGGLLGESSWLFGVFGGKLRWLSSVCGPIFLCVTQDMIFCAFPLCFMHVLPHFYTWLPKINNSPKMWKWLKLNS